MQKTVKGLLMGAVAGVLDVIPMILQGLTWDANLSAFSMWVVIGFFLVNINLSMPGFLKGILISFLTLLPTGIIIGAQEPISLIPIGIMTIILGALLGIVSSKVAK